MIFKLIIFFLIIFSPLALASDKELSKEILAILKLEGSYSLFKVSNCHIDKQKLMMLMLAQTPFTDKIVFNKECSLEGSYTAKLAVPFPIDFKLNNFAPYTKLKGNILIKLIFEPVPQIQVVIQNGHLIGKREIFFHANYAVEIDPMGKQILKKHLGGILTIEKVEGKSLGKTYPLNF